MDKFIYEGKVMWSQIDSNRHLRHSAYADFAAQARLEFLTHLGFNSAILNSHQLGPILFREEIIYHKEVGANETIHVTCVITKWNPEKGYWSFTQELYRSDKVKAATIIVDGAWLNLSNRKLTVLPQTLSPLFSQIIGGASCKKS
jgi:acyl-CoA thioester hydrolase